MASHIRCGSKVHTTPRASQNREVRSSHHRMTAPGHQIVTETPRPNCPEEQSVTSSLRPKFRVFPDCTSHFSTYNHTLMSLFLCRPLGSPLGESAHLWCRMRVPGRSRPSQTTGAERFAPSPFSLALRLALRPSSVLAWRVLADSPDPNAPRVHASDAHGLLRAIHVRSVTPTVAARHHAIPSSTAGAPGSRRPAPGEQAPERTGDQRPSMDRSRSARHTIQYWQRPSTDAHRRRRSWGR